jgi:hypothetical protein
LFSFFWFISNLKLNSERVATISESAVPAAIPMDSDNATRQINPAEPPLVPNNQLPPSENKLLMKWRWEFSLITVYCIDPAGRVFTGFTINRRNCERRKKGLVELRHLILAISGFAAVSPE